MNDASMSREELLAELSELRQKAERAEAREAQHKTAEAALRESESKYRSLFENATEGV
jgi:hypothetical protein